MTTRAARRRGAYARLVGVAPARRLAPRIPTTPADVGLRPVIGKPGLFATMVRDRLEAADWSTMREIICTLVRRTEVADDAVRVVFRVDPGSSGPSQPLRRLPHCPTRGGAAAHVGERHRLPPGRGG